MLFTLRRGLGVCTVVLASIGFAMRAEAVVVMDWVTVGNPNNAIDTSPIVDAGTVGYTYKMGKYEVTNAQFVEFMNAKYKSSTKADGLALPQWGITRSGVSGNYSYAVAPGYENRPINYVSWIEAARFANWLHNGQGNGDTETGSYTITGPRQFVRTANATYVLPTLDEWHKAAYHQPASAGGDVDNYWAYPTATNATPNSDGPPADAAIQNNAANFYRDDGIANGYNNGYASPLTPTSSRLLPVGSYGFSASYYGTFDQGGNIAEWTETPSASLPGGFHIRGGHSEDEASSLDSFSSSSADFSAEWSGFRLAMVPEPSGVGACLIAATAVLARRRRAGV